MKKLSPVKGIVTRLADLFIKKEPKKPYELVPFRTRIRQYVRSLEIRSKGNMSYNTLKDRIKTKFGVSLDELNITNKDAKKLIKTKKVRISKKDIMFEGKRR